MRVGVVAVDSLIPNVALMRISAWHKAAGDTVEVAAPLWGEYDRVYRSKVFTFTPDDPTPWDCEVVSGGTGYSLDSVAPCPETIYPDYALFDCKPAMGRLTRGCIRRCPWCVVWRQDGTVRQVADLDDFLHDQEQVRLLDDNLTALPELFVQTCEILGERGTETWFDGLDIRLMDERMARALAGVNLWGKTVGRARFAFDHPDHEAGVRRGIKALKAGGFPLYKATFYVLIGAGTTEAEDLQRVRLLEDLGVDSFVMPFDKTDPYQRRFARWCNRKAIFRSTEWQDFRE